MTDPVDDEGKGPHLAHPCEISSTVQRVGTGKLWESVFILFNQRIEASCSGRGSPNAESNRYVCQLQREEGRPNPVQTLANTVSQTMSTLVFSMEQTMTTAVVGFINKLDTRLNTPVEQAGTNPPVTGIPY